MNVGASAPDQVGLYFSWGNTDGHDAESGFNFSREVYQNSPGADLSDSIPLSHDAAHVNMGGSWRMPTLDDFNELINNCDFEWVVMEDTFGALVTSNVNGNSIFIPAGGSYENTQINDLDQNGLYFSSLGDGDNGAFYAFFEESNVEAFDSMNRYIGLPVRGVTL